MRLRPLYAPGMSVRDLALPGAVILRGAVGAGGSNARTDTAAVQSALNAVPSCTEERFGNVPLVTTPEEPRIAPKKTGEKDPFDYPAGF